MILRNVLLAHFLDEAHKVIRLCFYADEDGTIADRATRVPSATVANAVEKALHLRLLTN